MDRFMPLAFDIASLHAAYAGGLDPREVAAEVDRRGRAPGTEAIFITRPGLADLMAAAGRLPAFDPARYPLWGVPFAVKDNIDVAGETTTAGCPAYAYRAGEDAAVVARLKAAGGLFVGKTNLDQFATGLVGVRSPYGVPKNAFDETRVPGGSSSGSAIAVARGVAAFALGTDTAGSGRVPAGLNDLVGLKPSVGAVSTRGVVPACRTLDCVSVFATTVSDAFAVYAAMRGFDPADPYSRPIVADDMASAKPATRLGVPKPDQRLFFGDEAMARAYEAALGRLAGLGVTIETVDMADFFAVARLLYEGPWVAERMATIKTLLDEAPNEVLPVIRTIVGKAAGMTAVDAFQAFYELAALKRRTEPVWSRIDALCLPTAPIFPTLAELAADSIGPNSRLGTYTNFVNLLDLAGIAVPGPFRSDGLPAGVTFIGPRGSDASLAALAKRFEATPAERRGARAVAA